jgi:hypothetical protein
VPKHVAGDALLLFSLATLALSAAAAFSQSRPRKQLFFSPKATGHFLKKDSGTGPVCGAAKKIITHLQLAAFHLFFALLYQVFRLQRTLTSSHHPLGIPIVLVASLLFILLKGF